MTDLNPMVPGDVPYPQYSVVTTMPVSAIDIVKGVVYRVNSSGQLEDVSNDSVDLATGIFQAMADITIAGTAGENEVQVLGPRTRMIFIDSAGGLTPGQDVKLVANTDIVIVGTKDNNFYIGKIFEIYTRNTDSSKKFVSAAGDRVVVETVQP